MPPSELATLTESRTAASNLPAKMDTAACTSTMTGGHRVDPATGSRAAAQTTIDGERSELTTAVLKRLHTIGRQWPAARTSRTPTMERRAGRAVGTSGTGGRARRTGAAPRWRTAVPTWTESPGQARPALRLVYAGRQELRKTDAIRIWKFQKWPKEYFMV